MRIKEYVSGRPRVHTDGNAARLYGAIEEYTRKAAAVLDEPNTEMSPGMAAMLAETATDLCDELTIRLTEVIDLRRLGRED